MRPSKTTRRVGPVPRIAARARVAGPPGRRAEPDALPASAPSPTAAKEARLLREVQRWMAETADKLVALIQESQALRQRLAATEAYRRVDGDDEAEQEPIWDTAATLEVLLERALEEIVRHVRDGAKPRFPGLRLFMG